MNKTVIAVIAVVVVIAALPILSKVAGGAAPAASPGAAASSPEAPATAPAGATDAKSIAQDIAAALGRGDFGSVTARFDSTMSSALPQSKLAETWNAVVSQAGAFKKQLGVRTDKAHGMDVAFVTCEFEKAKLDVQVTLNASGKVAGIFIRPAT